jgi:hypothetical protein
MLSVFSFRGVFFIDLLGFWSDVVMKAIKGFVIFINFLNNDEFYRF